MMLRNNKIVDTLLTAVFVCALSILSTNATAQANDYQSKAISPAHRAKLDQDLQTAKSCVAAARNPQEWGVAMEELCKQFLQGEDYDNAVKAAKAVSDMNGVDPERRAAHHFLVAQIYELKMEASPNTGEMQKNKQMAISATQDVLSRNYPKKWGITDEAQKLYMKLRSTQHTQSVATDVSKRQTGGVTYDQLMEARRQSQSIQYNSMTGSLRTGPGFWDRLHQSDNYDDAPSLSGGKAMSDYEGMTPQDFTESGAKRQSARSNNDNADINAMQRPTRRTSNGYIVEDEPGYISPTGAVNKTGGKNLTNTLRYSPYPSVPSLNKKYESKTHVESPVSRLLGGAKSPEQKRLDGITAGKDTSSLKAMSTSELVNRAAQRSADVSRYGTSKGEAATRAYSYETDAGAKARSKRPSVYQSRNQSDMNTAGQTTQRSSASHGGLMIEGTNVGQVNGNM